MTAQLDGLKVAVLLEDGVNEVEFHYSRLRLKEAGADVVVIGNDRLDYHGELFEELHADITIEQADSKDFDGVLIPGGLAPEKLRLNARIVDFVRDLSNRGKVCAAICHGQQILISAGILKGKRAVAAWSMVDDLTFTGAVHVPEARAVRDGAVVTGRFIQDLPQFVSLVLDAFAEIENRPLPEGNGNRLEGKTFGIVVDDAAYDMHVFYARGRIEEEGGEALILGRKERSVVHLGNDTWEWGDHGYTIEVERALANRGAVDSHDFPYEDELRSVRASELDGLILPGGLATWMVRGHPGLKELIREMDSRRKPITTIGRGPKILISAGVVSGRKITCSPKMRDDLIAGGVEYQDRPVVVDENLISCKGTDWLPEWGKAFVDMVGSAGKDNGG